MIQNIPSRFNKMVVYKRPSSPVPPVTNVPFSLQAINGGGSVRLVPDSNPGPIVLDYKVNYGSWSSYTIGDTINLDENDIVYMSGANVNFSDGFGDYKGRYIFNLGGNIKAAGNIQSLVNFSDTCTDYCFNGLFGDQTLVDASELLLPATNLGMMAYNSMFSWTPLVAAPSCLPATSISNSCYGNMFGYCMSLTNAPQIMATSPNSSCGNMFMGCFNLTAMTVHFTDWGINGNQNWVQSLPANGTFTKPAALSTEYGDNYIPQGWTVVDI